MTLKTQLAQLRHAYAQLSAGTVRNQKQFADGLIAPAIRAVETTLRRLASSDGVVKGEPTAWLHRHESFGRDLQFTQLTAADRKHGWTEQPLYTAPPADAGMREEFIRVLASLAAAISILERTPKAKKAVASDKMFDTMLDDYRKALEIGRAALTAPGATTKSDGIHPSHDIRGLDASIYCTVCNSVDAELEKPCRPSDPSSTRSEVTVEGIASVMGCLRVMWSGSDWVIAEDSVSEAARALLDQFEIRRK